MRVTYVGHATLLIESDGHRILTDPNFDSSLGTFLTRVSAPGIALHELPKLDLILLTHAHADHLSFRSLNALRAVPLLAPPMIARWLQKLGYGNARSLSPGEKTQSGDLEIFAAAATHKGNRYGFDRWRSAANMYLIDTKSTSCFFAGDTALNEDTPRLVDQHVREIGRRLDIALLPIGHAPAWKPGFRKGHLTSADALTLFERLDARFLIPYHWGTFNHVTSKAHDAIERLRGHVKHHPRGPDVRILHPGEVFELQNEAVATASS
jgi:L-ascorbate metabolism protein UlaG (beta-lactamase superfamily)